MAIRSILVNIDIDTSSPALLTASIDLAERFGAELVGFAGAEPSAVVAGLEGGATIGEIFAQGAHGHRKPRWRPSPRSSAPACPHTSSRSGGPRAQSHRRDREPRALRRPHRHRIGAGRERQPRPRRRRPAAQAGRRVGRRGGAGKVKAEKVVVGWKDTREARRAVADALPLLKAADEVLVGTVEERDYSAEWSSLNDVVHWLELHEVKVRGEILPLSGSPAETVATAAASIGADLVVTGGYGHSRLREWLLGGVTEELLSMPTISRLMSN